MCDKCKEYPENRNTRYCDDWWGDSPHGGYKGDAERKEKYAERAREDENTRGFMSWDW